MNKVLFEVSYLGNLYATFHVILTFCGLCFLLFGNKRIIKTSKKEGEIRIGSTSMKTSVIILAVYILVMTKGYINTVVQYKTGNYIEVEGVVQNYHFNSRGTDEYFILGGVLFTTQPIGSWGYCQTRKNGGVIVGNGQHLRIRYIRNGNEKVIVYIEQMIPETAIAIENRYIGKRKEKRNPDVRPKIDRNIPLEEIAEKIEYLYTYEKMLCEVSASSRYEELEPLPEGRMRMTIYMAEGNKVLFLPEGAGNKAVLINGELCKLYYSEEREGYLFYFIDDCEENEGGVPVNAVGNGGWEEWFGVCIMEGESQPYSDSRYYTYYPRFDFAGLYKIGEIEVNLDAQKQISLPDIDVQGNEYIESMIRAVQRTLAEKENYGDFEMYLGTYGRMSYGRNGNLTVFKASGCVIGKDLEQYFYFTIYDACPEGTVISAAVPYYPPSEQEYESGKYYFTGGEWLPAANQEERIQKIKEIERVVIPFTVIEGEDYEDGEEHEVCDEKKHEEAEKIDFDTMSAEEAINMISYLYSYSEWFGMYELGCPVGEVRGLKDKELIIYTDNSGEWLYFIPADKANEVFVCEDGREYPVYINEEGSAEFYSIRWNPAAVKKEQLKTTLWMIRSTDLKTSLEDYVMLGRKTLEIQDFSLLETPEVESDEYVEALEDYIGDLLAKAEKYGEYKVYIGEYEAMDANRVCLSVAVSGDGGGEYYFRYLIIRSEKGMYYFWPAGFGLDGSLEECSAERHHMNAVCFERTKQLERRESVLSITL